MCQVKAKEAVGFAAVTGCAAWEVSASEAPGGGITTGDRVDVARYAEDLGAEGAEAIAAGGE